MKWVADMRRDSILCSGATWLCTSNANSNTCCTLCICVSKVLVEEVVPFLNNVCYWEGYMAPFARQLDFETLVPVCTHWHSCVYIISEWNSMFADITEYKQYILVCGWLMNCYAGLRVLSITCVYMYVCTFTSHICARNFQCLCLKNGFHSHTCTCMHLYNSQFLLTLSTLKVPS